VSRQQHETEIEPLIVPGCTREITSLNLGSIVLPKEAFFTSNDAGARLRARGRGRSLTNRALGIDKPSRRPGEKNISHEVGTYWVMLVTRWGGGRTCIGKRRGSVLDFDKPNSYFGGEGA
jgi:hypothetical protein